MLRRFDFNKAVYNTFLCIQFFYSAVGNTESKNSMFIILSCSKYIIDASVSFCGEHCATLVAAICLKSAIVVMNQKSGRFSILDDMR
jgi:hypothetical protein